MRCLHGGCSFGIDSLIKAKILEAEQIEVLKPHVKAEHTQTPVANAELQHGDAISRGDKIKGPFINTESTDSRQSESLNDGKYYNKNGSGVKGNQFRIKLLECGSKELQSNLFRNTGGGIRQLQWRPNTVGDGKSAVKVQIPLFKWSFCQWHRTTSKMCVRIQAASRDRHRYATSRSRAKAVH